MLTLFLDGHIGQNAEIRTSATGRQYVVFSMANSRLDAKKERKTTWFNIVSYNESIIKAASHLTKGRYIIVNGRFDEPEIYTDKQGNNKISLRVTANSIDFGLSSSGSTASYKSAPETDSAVQGVTMDAPSPTPTPAPKPAPAVAPVEAAVLSSNGDGEEDGLPF